MAVPSSTILLLRDGADGLEVFMVVRHHQIDFASGALVFPGGKVDAGDRVPGLRARCVGADRLDDETLAVRIGAIREAFEECGVLLARARSGGLVEPAALPHLSDYRTKLHSGAMPIGDFLEAEDLTLALDLLVPYAHWVTPDFMPRRFDTYFYLAAAPVSHDAVHDGTESVDSVWINPERAMREADDGKWTIIFPTRMNLMKLARSRTVEEALAKARDEAIVTVKPWIEERAGQKVLCIQPDAGYGDVTEPIDHLP